MTVSRMAPIALTLLLITACSDAGPGASGADPGLDGPDRVLAWAPEPVYTVGGFEAPDWAAFGSVNQVGFDSKGYLYVLDGQAKTIVRISPTGEPAGTIGAPGGGPGELGNPMAMAVSSDDRVVVADMMHRGFVVYDTDGEWVGNVPIDMGAEGLPMRGLTPHPDGGLVSPAGLRMGSSSAGRSTMSFGTSEGRPLHHYTLRDSTPGSDFYSAWDPPEPEGEGAELSGSGAGGNFRMAMARMQAFEPGLSFGILPDGRVAVVDSSAYRVKLVDLGTGEVTGTLARPISPTPVDDRIEGLERDRQLELAEQSSGMTTFSFGGSGAGPSIDEAAVRRMRRDRVETMVFYPEIPVIEALAVDREGRIWVQRSSGIPGQDGPTDLVTADEEYLGTLPADGVRIPDAFGPAGLAAYVEKDDLDVPVIRVVRLPVS